MEPRNHVLLLLLQQEVLAAAVKTAGRPYI